MPLGVGSYGPLCYETKVGVGTSREALDQSVERAKKQYNKRAARTCYKVSDAVWHLVKGTNRVKNKIRKFLPNHDGPYFILLHLDDLVYWIQRNPRNKDVPAPNLEADGADLDLDLSRLFTEQTENSSGSDSMPLMDDTGVQITEQDTEDVQWSEGSTVQQDLGTVNSQMSGRPQRVIRPLRRPLVKKSAGHLAWRKS
ncbi:hypothetical protein QQF64_036465 [Cirrhinus molitorella]|uniref:Uncharacterized protein n=1 Tax=Cirrhinus molitorella TaxID=172907 RepID=A0ABR3NIJ6_9TELE